MIYTAVHCTVVYCTVYAVHSPSYAMATATARKECAMLAENFQLDNTMKCVRSNTKAVVQTNNLVKLFYPSPTKYLTKANTPNFAPTTSSLYALTNESKAGI